MNILLRFLLAAGLLLAAELSTMAQELIILGVAQDGGYPHIGCSKSCCAKAWQEDSLKNNVVSFALVDTVQHTWWLFEATPDITRQLHLFQQLTAAKYAYLPAGIFVTHAHIGHYTGLMYLGREAMNTRKMPVYTLPRMGEFLARNGPWSQLVSARNIALKTMQPDRVLTLNDRITVTAFAVPHRDEFSETSGFSIRAGDKRILFIPDIDKWQKWDKRIVEEVKKVDIALLDATFSTETELPDQKISEVPHPFVGETVALFSQEARSVKQKIYFIHFNHTNPLLWDEKARKALREKGFNQAQLGQRL